MHENNRTVTREELYDLVWSKPMSLLAKEFEISDVGLAKICKRMEIPRPTRGYWQKHKVGETPPQIKLPPLSEKGVTLVVIQPTPKPKFLQEQVQKIEKIPVPDTLENPHPLTQKTLKAFAKGKVSDYGNLLPKNDYCLDIHVSKEALQRACLIMDTLIRALEARHYPVSITSDSPRKTVIMVRGETLDIGLEEKIRRVEHIPTPTEQKKHEKYYWYIPRYDYVPSGQLTLRIKNADCQGVRQQWADGKVKRVEDHLGSFIASLEPIVQAIDERRKERERRHREWEEAERQRAEQHRLALLEEQKAKKLIKDVSQWIQAIQIRDYIGAIENDAVTVPGLDAWLSWARNYANCIDPIQCPETLAFDETKENKQGNWWHD